MLEEVMAENCPKLTTDCKTGLGISGIWSRIIKYWIHWDILFKLQKDSDKEKNIKISHGK